MAELKSQTRPPRAVVASCLIWLFTAAVMAQSTSPPSSGGPVVVVTGQGEPLVSVRPGEIGCRALLAEIARQANVLVRNLALVPDDVVYVQLRDAPVPDAIASVLRFAKVDYVLRGGGAGSGPWLLLVADRTAASAALRATDSAGRAPSDGSSGVTDRPTPFRSSSREAARSPFGPAPELAAEPTQAPVLEPAASVYPATGQVPNLPDWHPGEPLPSATVNPPEASPRTLESRRPTAPRPTVPSPAGTDGPTPFRSPSREAARSPVGPPPELVAEPTQAPVLEPAADVDPATGQVPNLPEWRPGLPLPAPALIPPEARPRSFEFKMPVAPWPTAAPPSTPEGDTPPAPSTPAPVPPPAPPA